MAWQSQVASDFPPQMHPLEPFPIFHINAQVRARAVTVQPPSVDSNHQRGEAHSTLPSYSSETDQLLIQFPSLVQYG